MRVLGLQDRDPLNDVFPRETLSLKLLNIEPDLLLFEADAHLLHFEGLLQSVLLVLQVEHGLLQASQLVPVHLVVHLHFFKFLLATLQLGFLLLQHQVLVLDALGPLRDLCGYRLLLATLKPGFQ